MKQEIRLALSSGGARGIAHIGVIRALEEANYPIQCIAGTSIGAVVGGIHAIDKLSDFSDWLLKLEKLDVWKLIDFTFSTSGFIKGDRVLNEIKQFTGSDALIEDLSIPFSAVATSIKTGTPVVFNKGDLFTAIRASMAIPNVVTPLNYEKDLLVDGGLVAPLPIAFLPKVNSDSSAIVVAVDLNASGGKAPKLPYNQKKKKREIENQTSVISTLYARMENYLKSNSTSKQDEEKLNYISLAMRSFDIMQDLITQTAMDHQKPDILIEIPRTAADTFDFYRAGELIDIGYQKASEALETYKKNNS
jgi:NTE family protein